MTVILDTRGTSSTSAMSHTLTRHREILTDYARDARRTTAQIREAEKRSNLLGSVRAEISSFKQRQEGQSDTDMLLGERSRIDESNRMTDQVLEQAYATRYEFAQQRGMLGGVNSRMKGVICGCIPKRHLTGTCSPSVLASKSADPPFVLRVLCFTPSSPSARNQLAPLHDQLTQTKRDIHSLERHGHLHPHSPVVCIWVSGHARDAASEVAHIASGLGRDLGYREQAGRAQRARTRGASSNISRLLCLGASQSPSSVPYPQGSERKGCPGRMPAWLSVYAPLLHSALLLIDSCASCLLYATEQAQRDACIGLNGKDA
jgi:hypothetical protein